MEEAKGEEAVQKRSLNYSQLKRAAKERVIPELKEDDLEEKFVRGTFYYLHTCQTT